MIIYRHLCKKYSKIQDEDYYDDVERNRRDDIKSENRKTVGRALVLGATGFGTGLVGGAMHMQLKRRNKDLHVYPTTAAILPLIGTGVGVTGAIIKGKKNKKKIHKRHDNEIYRYNDASESDKEYLRRRMENELKDRGANKRTKEITKSINNVGNSVSNLKYNLK